MFSLWGFKEQGFSLLVIPVQKISFGAVKVDILENLDQVDGLDSMRTIFIEIEMNEPTLVISFASYELNHLERAKVNSIQAALTAAFTLRTLVIIQ